MANVRGTRGVGDGSKPGSEKIVPSAGWTEDSNSQYLLVDLPGFKAGQVQIQVVSTGDIKVSGERVTNQNRTVRFDQTYKIPAAENADMSKITAKFDGEILYVTIPKKPKEEKLEEPKKRSDEEQKKRNEEQKEEATPSLEKKKDDVVNGLEEKNNDTQQQKPEDEVVAKNKEENTQKILEKDKVKDGEEKTQQKPSEAKTQQKPSEEKTHQKPSEAKTQQKPKDDEVKNKAGDEKSSKKEEKKLKGNESERFSEDDVKKWEDDGNCLRNTIKILSQNKGILLTAVIAFSLGLLLSRRFHVGR